MSYMSELDIQLQNIVEELLLKASDGGEVEDVIHEAVYRGASCALEAGEPQDAPNDDDDGGLRACAHCGGKFTGPGEYCPVCRAPEPKDPALSDAFSMVARLLASYLTPNAQSQLNKLGNLARAEVLSGLALLNGPCGKAAQS